MGSGCGGRLQGQGFRGEAWLGTAGEEGTQWMGVSVAFAGGFDWRAAEGGCGRVFGVGGETETTDICSECGYRRASRSGGCRPGGRDWWGSFGRAVCCDWQRARGVMGRCVVELGSVLVTTRRMCVVWVLRSGEC